MVYKAEYIWIDGTEPTSKLRSKTKIVPDGAPLPIWGFDGSSTNQATGDKSDCILAAGVRLPGPDPRRRAPPRDVRGAAGRRQAAPEQHARRVREDGQEVRQARVPVRHRAGVHVLQGRPPVRLPGRRLPRAAGRLLLRRRLRRDLRPRHRRGAPRQLPRRRPVLQRAQRRGDDRPVGVPDRPARPGRGRRSAVDRPLAAVPHGRGVRRRRHARPEADEGRLERRRRAHQLLHRRDARGGRLPVHRERLQGARQEVGAAHQELRPRHRGPPHRPPRDGAVEQVLLRRVRPWGVDPHPAAGPQGRPRLPRGPPPERQHRPVRRHPPDGGDGLLARI